MLPQIQPLNTPLRRGLTQGPGSPNDHAFDAWARLGEARATPFHHDRPDLWALAFHRLACEARDAFVRHQSDAEARDSLLRHHAEPDDEQCLKIQRQFADHRAISSALADLVTMTARTEANPLGQMIRATDAAVMAQMTIALHHRRLERILLASTSTPGPTRVLVSIGTGSP